MRKVVRGAGGRYRVLKNKLAARASKGTKIEQALQGLKGVSSVAYTSGDPVALAKALSTWMTENAEFTFKLGIVDGHVINVEEVKQLATMPSKGGDLLQAPVPDQCPGPAPGHSDERDRPRRCGRHQPGSGARKIRSRRRAGQAAGRDGSRSTQGRASRRRGTSTHSGAQRKSRLQPPP